MIPDDSIYPHRAEPATSAVFPPTQWNVVLAASATGSSDAHNALETLCRAYWFPLYAYCRRRGYSPHDAQDLTQEFFAQLLPKNFLDGVEPAKGKFRSFLLASLNHFLANWEKHRNAKKRGGGKIHLSLDAETAEDLYKAGACTSISPEEEYNRRWTTRLLEQAFTALQAEYRSNRNEQVFSELKAFLEEERAASGDYADVAEKLQMTPNAVAVCVRRMRLRYRELVRAEVSRTVAGGEAFEDELRFLLRTLAS